MNFDQISREDLSVLSFEVIVKYLSRLDWILIDPGKSLPFAILRKTFGNSEDAQGDSALLNY
mgnify:CR=1 FL=1